MNIKNKVGLEAEFLLRNNKGELVFPRDYGFEVDEFEILGEFRADAGWTRHETVGNFLAKLSEVMDKAESKGLLLDLSGVAEITPQKKAEIIRKVGSKYVPPCNNVYKTDILSFSDDVVGENGQISASRISAGLHVHFSRRIYHEYVTKFIKKGGATVEETNKVDENLLTDSQIKQIVRNMDKHILPQHSLGIALKYRMAGFYEKKLWGFEYRSLPMTQNFTYLQNLRTLVNFAFSQLEKLEK